MGQPTQLVPAAPRSVWEMYRAMVGVSMVCGLLIVTVFEMTRPVIERKRAAALQEAIFEVLPDVSSSAAFRLTEAGSFEKLQDKGEPRIYAGYDAAQQLVGFAVEAQGMGYQDVIHVLYGYSFAEDAIVGIRVLESKETPGLGTKIETDPEFLENFKRLSVALTADLSRIEHPIEPVKHGKKEHPWQVDGITGATISSKAIANILSDSTAFWIPRIRQNLNDFKEEG